MTPLYGYTGGGWETLTRIESEKARTSRSLKQTLAEIVPIAAAGEAVILRRRDEGMTNVVSAGHRGRDEAAKPTQP